MALAERLEEKRKEHQCTCRDTSSNDPQTAEGHLVSKSYADLLSRIKSHHPETFYQATFCTVAVETFAHNFLAEFYTSLAEKRLVDVDIDGIDYFKAVLADLEMFNLNVKWLSERVDMIEEVKLSCPLVAELDELRKRAEDKKRDVALVKEELAKVEAELDELNSLCGEKAAEVNDAYGDTVHLADGLLPKL